MDKQFTLDQLLQEINKPEILGVRKTPISIHVFREWRKRGVIPPPHKTSKGRGKGVIGKYPYSLLPQIKRLIELLEENRSIDKAIMVLWLEGFQVDYKPVLLKAVAKYEKFRYSLFGKLEGEIKISETGMEKVKQRYENNRKRHYSRTVSAAGKKIRKDFETFKLTLFSLITGSHDPVDVDIFYKGVGFSGLYEKDKKRIFEDISNSCSPEYLRKLIEKENEDELKLSYILLSAALDIMMEFPEMRKALKGFPICHLNNETRFVLLFLYILGSLKPPRKYGDNVK